MWRGGASIFAKAVLDSLNDTSRAVWLADSFSGLPTPRASGVSGDVEMWSHMSYLAVSQEEVRISAMTVHFVVFHYSIFRL